MVMNERRVTEQNRPGSQLSHKKILDTIGKQRIESKVLTSSTVLPVQELAVV